MYNTFDIFKSIDDIIYLIYVNKNNSIIAYNLIDNKIIIEIRKAHDSNITNFRHFSDRILQIDLIMSISAENRNLKIWDACKWECILTLVKIYNYNLMLLSACFLNDNNNIYIITSHYNKSYDNKINDLMKVYDLTGKKIKNIRNSLYSSYFIDTYYDNKKSKNYIISGNKYNIVSYDYEKNKKYYEYCIDELNLNELYHYCIFIDNSDK